MKCVTKCKKCGKNASVDTSKVLTTYPEQYGYTCEHCGERNYCYTYEAYLYDEKPISYGLQGLKIPTTLSELGYTTYNLDAVINEPYIQIGGKQFKTKDFIEALKKLMEENE